MENLVVGHYLSGQLVKGRCVDFSPTKPFCNVQTAPGQMVRVTLRELKALFLVHSLEGKPRYEEHRTPSPADPRRVGAKPMEVRFRDGERMVGFVTAYSEERPLFFLLPADPASNNARVLVNRDAVISVRPLP